MSVGAFVNLVATLNIPRCFTILLVRTRLTIMIVKSIFDRFISFQDLLEDNLNKKQGFYVSRVHFSSSSILSIIINMN